ncbi:MAG TPA: MCE family protein [Desulfobulbaceae bacterium]|nr:MCE family protein [Desulfobulbaceae bacterium]
MQQPELKNKSFISPIWFLPFIALCIGGWLLYTSYRDAGIDIIIHFATAEGVTAGKTKVIYKGIAVGTVKKVEIDGDLKGIDLHIEMNKKTRPGLVKDTKFWIVRPEISAGRITGLETLVSGSYIAVKKGNATTESRFFEGLETPPPLDSDAPGLHITLKTPSLYSLQRGSRVYSKNLNIGLVEDYSLDRDEMITLKILIKPEFRHLIHEGTRFWNASGLSVSGDLQTGLTVNMESLASLIYGGISCATPKELQNTPTIQSGRKYHLYKDFEDAQYGVSMTLQLATGAGIVAGKTKVLYRGLKAGVVKSLDINNDTFHTVTATILLDPRAEVILRKNTRFWVIRPQVSIEGIKNLETLISGAYITFQIGGGPHCDQFIVEANPMPIPTLRPGTMLTLKAKDSGSLTIGTPVFYRKLIVGEITDIALTENGKGVRTTILIYKPFDQLVADNSIFWNVSGVQINGNLSNFKINLSSMRAMLAGGVTFVTPKAEQGEKQPPGKIIKKFHLYESYHDAVAHESALQPDGLSLQIQTEKPAAIKIGSPVLYNNIKIGEVMDLSLARKSHRITIDLLIFQKFRYLINGFSRFYALSGIKAEASLQGILLEAGSLESIFSGGISLYNPRQTSRFHKGTIFHLYKNLNAAKDADGLRLTLYLHSAKSINGHTKIRYQGIEIGRIIDVDFNPEFDQVIARAVVRREAKKLFREDTILYLVGPQMNLAGIRNLETVLVGSYISLLPGKGKPADTFSVSNQAQGGNGTIAGLQIILESPTRGSLGPGSPIYYRRVPVGSITGYQLSPTGRQVWLQANILPEYVFIVHKGTKFWNVSGLEVDGGVFSGMSIRTESMEALIRGGVALATPAGKAMGGPVTDGAHFPLAKKARDDWKAWSPNLKLTGHAAGETDVPGVEIEQGQQQTYPEENKDDADASL